MAVREDKDSKTARAEECRGKQTCCTQPGQVQLPFCREENERHKPKGKGGAWGGSRGGPILPLAWSCEAALLPFSTATLGGRSVALLGSLRRAEKGEAGFAQRRGAPCWLSLRSPRLLCQGHWGHPVLPSMDFQTKPGTAMQRGASAKELSVEHQWQWFQRVR